MSEWDKYRGDFVKFEAIGDNVKGTVRSVSFDGTDFNGNPCPLVIIEEEDGTIRTLTVGQVMLQRALAEHQPAAGDSIAIVYKANGEGKPGRAPAKLFDVAVKRASTAAADSGVSADSLI